jgi:hypothetical protein
VLESLATIGHACLKEIEIDRKLSVSTFKTPDTPNDGSLLTVGKHHTCRHRLPDRPRSARPEIWFSSEMHDVIV